MAEQLDGLEAVEIDGITATRYEHAGEKNPKWQKCMVVFGQAGIVRKFSNAKKIHPRGVVCMMVGYPDNHSEDVYLMCNPATGKRLTSRDVTWLPRMMCSKKNRGNEITPSDDVVEVMIPTMVTSPLRLAALTPKLGRVTAKPGRVMAKPGRAMLKM